MAGTNIEWTDKVWNPVRGCVKFSAGCKHCYAETFAERWRGVAGHAYEQGFDLRLVPEKLEEPLHWQKPVRVFVNSMSDLFQEGVPNEFIDKVFAVMGLCGAERYRCLKRGCDHDGFDCEEGGASPKLQSIQTFQILTKRAERMRAYMNDRDTKGRIMDATRAVSWWDDTEEMLATAGWPFKNVWLGVSVENQAAADERIPLLLKTPAAVRWISAEPLLGPIVLDPLLWPDRRITDESGEFAQLHWVVVGGESGPGARPFDLGWAQDIVRECRKAGVAPFVKQLGAWPVTDNVNRFDFPEHTAFESCDYPTAAAAALKFRDKKGGDMAEWPEDLRVREFPREVV